MRVFSCTGLVPLSVSFWCDEQIEFECCLMAPRKNLSYELTEHDQFSKKNIKTRRFAGFY